MKAGGASRSRRRAPASSGWRAWLAALLVVGGGFSMGFGVGVVAEDPRLVLDLVAGRATPVTPEDLREEGLSVAGSPAPGARATAAPDADARTSAAERRATATKTSAPVAPSLPAAPAARGERSRAEPPEVASGPPGSGFAVQVGAFSEREAARRLADELRRSGHPVYLAASEGEARWRVRVGPVTTREQAERLAGRLQNERRLPTWVLEETGR